MKNHSGGREDVHIVYRSQNGQDNLTIVTPEQRNALHQAGRLVADRGSTRYLASADNWSNKFFLHHKAPKGWRDK